MEPTGENGSGILKATSLFGLGVTSIGYAAFLNTDRGKRFADEYTWASVVLGVLYTLFWLAFEDVRTARKILVYFAVSGVPMIARSLINRQNHSNLPNNTDA